MQNPDSDYVYRVWELQKKTTDGYRNIWREYSADIQRYAADARSKAGELWQTYLQEVEAARASDGAMEAAGAAGAELSRAYSELEDQYLTACRERMRGLSESLTSLGAEYGQHSIDGMIQYLESLRAQMGSDGAKPSPRKSSKSET